MTSSRYGFIFTLSSPYSSTSCLRASSTWILSVFTLTYLGKTFCWVGVSEAGDFPDEVSADAAITTLCASLNELSLLATGANLLPSWIPSHRPKRSS